MCMKALKIWGWLLFAASVILSGYGWISGEFDGHGIASMDPVPLMLTIVSVVCLLLAITVLIILTAIKKSQEDN